MGTVGTIASVTAAINGNGQRSGSIRIRGSYNLSVWGVFVATGRLERSFDGGTTWIPVSKDSSGADASFTAPCGITGYEPEDGVLYSFISTAYTSGTMNVRISQ